MASQNSMENPRSSYFRRVIDRSLPVAAGFALCGVAVFFEVQAVQSAQVSKPTPTPESTPTSLTLPCPDNSVDIVVFP